MCIGTSAGPCSSSLLSSSSGILAQFASFWSFSQRRNRALYSLLLGLFLLSSSRFAFSTLHPLWLSVSTTLMGVLTGLFALFISYLYEPEPPARFSVEDLEANSKSPSPNTGKVPLRPNFV